MFEIHQWRSSFWLETAYCYPFIHSARGSPLEKHTSFLTMANKGSHLFTSSCPARIFPPPHKNLQYCTIPMQLVSPVIFHLTLTNPRRSVPFLSFFSSCLCRINPIIRKSSLKIISGILARLPHPDSCGTQFCLQKKAVWSGTQVRARGNAPQERG